MNKSVYHFFSALIFLGLGLIILLTDFLPRLTDGSRIGIGILLVLWGAFRGYKGWKLFSKGKQDNS